MLQDIICVILLIAAAAALVSCIGGIRFIVKKRCGKPIGKTIKTIKVTGLTFGVMAISLGVLFLFNGMPGHTQSIVDEQGMPIDSSVAEIQSVTLNECIEGTGISGKSIESAVNENEPSLIIPDSHIIPLSLNNYFDYQPGMECAAFASAFLLRHYGEEADGLTLFETFPSRALDGGTMPSGITTLFEERGYKAAFLEDGTVEDLKSELSKGNLVIVFIHVEEPYTTTHNTHYVPLVGYDSENFYFAESLSEYANCKDEQDLDYNRKTEISKFQRLWSNIDGFWDNPYYVIAPNTSN